MDLRLYFQVFNFDQSLGAAASISFAQLFSQRQLEGKAVACCGALVKRFQFRSIAKASERLQLRFNEAELQFLPESFCIDRDITVTYANAVLTPSPASELWFPSADWQVRNSTAVQQRMNAKAAEAILAQKHVRPTALEVVLAVQTVLSRQMLVQRFAELLATGIVGHPALLRIRLFGCADVGGNEIFIKTKSKNLMLEAVRVFASLPDDRYSELGERFDQPHLMIFGTEELCKNSINSSGAAINWRWHSVEKRAGDFCVVTAECE